MIKFLHIFKSPVLGIMLLFTASFANAATITSKATGNWSAAATWTPITRTGAITTTSGSKAVVGVGTAFTTELAVGSILYRSNGTTQIGVVASITDDTHLTLVANATSIFSSQAYTAAIVPTASDDVVISSGKTVTVDADAFAQSVSVSGTLKVNDGETLTVYNDFTVNSGGSFNMGSGSDVGTLLVYDDFLNNGTTDFWKSNVVIGGDFTTTTTALQNNGNIVIGGDISGNFNLTGGTGSNQIYATNPNATITITPTSVDNNVPPGTYPSGESAALQTLVNTVIYGGSCPFTVNNISNVYTCLGSGAVFTVSTSGATSPTYQWQVNKNDGNGWVDLTNTTPYSTVTTSSLNISSATAAMDNYQYRAKITASSCTRSGNPGKLSVTSTSTGSWIGVTSTDWNTASNWCGGIPSASTDVIIASGTPFQPTIAAGTTAYCNSLTVNASATLTMAASSTSLLKISGDFTNNGTFTAGAGSTVNYAGIDQSIAGVTYSNLTTSGSGAKTLSAAITVSNNLYIGTGTTLIDNENQITGNATGTLTVENGATLFLGRIAVNGTVGTAFPTNFTKAHIDLQTGSTVQYNSWVAQTISYIPDYYNIECQYPGTKSTSGAGTLTIDGSLGTASNLDLSSCTNVNLAGNFNLWGAGATVTLPTPGTFSIKGNFNRDVINSGGSITPGTGTVVFNGAAAQSITGDGTLATSFYNLTINNTSGGVSIAITGTNNDVTVTNTLTMTSGILTTSSSNLLNVTRTATAAISGGSSTSFISGPVKWTLATNLTGASTYNFPVGKGSTYLPFSLIPRTTTGTITAQVEAFDSNPGGTANFTNVGSISTTEYWSLVTTGNFTNTTSTISLSRPTAITPLDVIAGSTSANGTYTSLAGTVGTNGITVSSAIQTNRFFTFGRKNGIRTSTITGSPFCLGASVSVPYTISTASVFAAGNIFTAQLSDASGSFTSPVSIGTLTSTGAGTISATIPAGTAAGTGYRIRVVSSATPQTIGSDNGTDLTIKANNTVGAASSSPTTCINVAMANITHATTGATGIGSATGLPTGVTASWVSNTITISGTPTASGTFNYSIPLSGGCGSGINATGTIKVNLANTTITLTSAAGTSAQTLCNNTAITSIVYTVANGATGASITAGALPTGVTGVFSGSTFTISGTPTALGTFNYTVTTSGGCSAPSLSGSIIVNPCTYTWNGSVSSDWSTGGNWSDGAAPGVGDDALIPSSGVTNMPLVTTTGNARNLTVNSGGTLTITSPGVLTTKGAIANSGTITGTGTLTLSGTATQAISGTGTYASNITLNNTAGATLSNAVTFTNALTLTAGALTSNGNLTVDLSTGSIAGTGSGSITGNITVAQNVNSYKYHYLTTPLITGAATVADWNDDVQIKTGSYANLYYYNEAVVSVVNTDGWTGITSTSTALTPLKGYALYFEGPRVVDMTGAYTHGAAPSNITLTYTSSGDATVDGWNLVGNPYPSVVDWKYSGASGWTKTGIDDAIYCWDPTTSSYTSYVGTTGTNGGSRYIAPMQAYWVKVSAVGSQVFGCGNGTRVTGQSPVFFKEAAVTNEVRLKLSSSATFGDETVIVLADEATNSFDGDYDAYKLMNEDYTPSIYTKVDNNLYSINAIPNSTSDITVPLHLKVNLDGEYSITAKDLALFDQSYDVILEDTVLDVTQDLRTNPVYTCTAATTDSTARFLVHLRLSNVTSVNTPTSSSSVFIRGVDNNVKVDFANPASNVGYIGVFNTMGRKVAEVNNADISSGNYQIALPGEFGIYIVKVAVGEKVYTQKVFLR